LKGNTHLRSPSERKGILGNISEGAEDVGNAREETAVKIKHAQETLKGREGRGGQQGQDRRGWVALWKAEDGGLWQ
jgi:hypothetical protein